MKHNPGRVLLVFLLWFAGLLAGAQFAKIGVPIAEFRAHYPEVGDSVAWLLTLISMLGALFGVVTGVIANLIGMRTVLILCLAGGGLLSLWQSSMPGFGVLAASRVVEGVTHLGIVVTAPALIAQISSDRFRAAAMALWSTFFGVSFAITAWFGMPFIGTFGIDAFFLLHGALMILCAILLAPLIARNGQHEDYAHGARASFGSDVVRAYTSPSILWPGLGWLFYTLTFLSLLTILPERLPVDGRATVTGLMPIVGIGIALTIVPLVLQRMRATTLVMTGFALAVVSVVLTAWAPLGVLCIALYASLGLVQGASFAAVAELNLSAQTRMLGYGVMAQTGNLGNLLGTPALLLVLRSANINGLLIVVMVTYVCAIATLGLLRRHIRTV